MGLEPSRFSKLAVDADPETLHMASSPSGRKFQPSSQSQKMHRTIMSADSNPKFFNGESASQSFMNVTLSFLCDRVFPFFGLVFPRFPRGITDTWVIVFFRQAYSAARRLQLHRSTLRAEVEADNNQC